MDPVEALVIALATATLIATLVTFLARDLPRFCGRVDEVFVVENWPAVSGRGPETKTLRADRKAISSDGRWWLIRERGIFTRYRWRPVTGAFVTLHERRP